MCANRELRSSCAFAPADDQSFLCPHNIALEPSLRTEFRAKTLIRLRWTHMRSWRYAVSRLSCISLSEQTNLLFWSNDFLQEYSFFFLFITNLDLSVQVWNNSTDGWYNTALRLCSSLLKLYGTSFTHIFELFFSWTFVIMVVLCMNPALPKYVWQGCRRIRCNFGFAL